MMEQLVWLSAVLPKLKGANEHISHWYAVFALIFPFAPWQLLWNLGGKVVVGGKAVVGNESQR